MAHRSHATLKRVLASWSKTENLPIVHRNLNAARCRLALFDLLHFANNLHSALNGQVKSVGGADTVARQDTLHKAGAVTNDQEVVGLLRTESVDPSLEFDTFANKLRKSVHLTLQQSVQFLRMPRVVFCAPLSTLPHPAG